MGMWIYYDERCSGSEEKAYDFLDAWLEDESLLTC